MKYHRLAIIDIEETNPMEMTVPTMAAKLPRLAETMALMAAPALNKKRL
jgi:hypothetical protein